MTLRHYYNGSLVTSGVQLSSDRGYSSRAALGQVDMIRVIVEDPDGTRTFTGYKEWRIEETTCATPIVWRGYVGRQSVVRAGPGADGYWTDDGRVWELELVEDNGWLSRRMLRDSTANRPAETVSARLTWLLAQAEMPADDHGLVESSSVAVDEADYRGRYPVDVLQDLTTACGYNFFVRHRAASSDLELAFYDAELTLADSSSFAVSNVASDIDLSTTWPYETDARLDRDPERVASGVYVPFRGGAYYGSDSGTASEFASVDLAAPSANVKSYAAAVALSSRLLTQHSIQDERLALSVVVTPEHLNDIRHGQWMTVRGSHWPGYTSARRCRVVSKSFSRLDNDSESAFRIDLELVPQIETTYSIAYLMRPNDNDGFFPATVWWDHDGDNEQAGDAGPNQQGLLTYYPTPKPGTGWTGILVGGTGYVDLSTHFGGIEAFGGSGATVTAYFYRNGVSVGSTTIADPGGPGAHVWTWTIQFTASNVAVVAGDILSVYCTSTVMTTSTVPAGVGNGGHHFSATGYLAARS